MTAKELIKYLVDIDQNYPVRIILPNDEGKRQDMSDCEDLTERHLEIRDYMFIGKVLVIC